MPRGEKWRAEKLDVVLLVVHPEYQKRGIAMQLNQAASTR
jgi:GNAT superfamily N-acetyltransferase